MIPPANRPAEQADSNMTITQDALFLASLIFMLRIVNSAVGTIRLVVMARGQRLLVTVLSFIEAFIFAYVTANVITDLSNVLNLVAYCGGFALGVYFGMVLETRFVTSYLKISIITPTNGHDIALILRENGYGVTELHGEGGAGKVVMITCVVHRADAPRVTKLVYAVNPDAFVTMEEARRVEHGWLRTLRHTR
jgi:uncharacterized protein YebE (UPF0316 family)